MYEQLLSIFSVPSLMRFLLPFQTTMAPGGVNVITATRITTIKRQSLVSTVVVVRFNLHRFISLSNLHKFSL